MAEEKEVLLEVKGLNVTYGSGRKAFAAVQNANFQIYKGETFGLVGESGSGKTTIGRAILRILPTSGGEILYKGQKINGKIPRALDKQITREIQMIFQDPQSSLNERAKVSYIVGEGLQNVRPDLSAAQREEKVRQALVMFLVSVTSTTPVCSQYQIAPCSSACSTSVEAAELKSSCTLPRQHLNLFTSAPLLK